MLSPARLTHFNFPLSLVHMYICNVVENLAVGLHCSKLIELKWLSLSSLSLLLRLLWKSTAIRVDSCNVWIWSGRRFNFWRYTYNIYRVGCCGHCWQVVWGGLGLLYYSTAAKAKSVEKGMKISEEKRREKARAEEAWRLRRLHVQVRLNSFPVPKEAQIRVWTSSLSRPMPMPKSKIRDRDVKFQESW